MGIEGHRLEAHLRNAKSQVWHSIGSIGAFLRAKPDTTYVASEAQGSSASPHSGDSASEEIPVLHRLAILYLMLPVVIWLVGWFEWWFGVPLALLVAVGIWLVLKPGQAKINRRTLLSALRSALRPTNVALLLIAFGWVMVTGAGGVFDVHNHHWYKHQAIFLDLSRGNWPVFLPTWTPDLSTYLSEQVSQPGSLLRYYLGYYIVPGLVGKWFGTATLNVAVPLWTWCGVGLMLVLFTRCQRGWRVLAAATVLVFFSGMDLVSGILLEGLEWLEIEFAWEGWPEFRIGRIRLDGIWLKDVGVLYLSQMYGLMLIPQHFIAGALSTLLIVQLRRHGRFLAVSGVVLAASTFWSPFIAIGLLPLAAVMLIENGLRRFLQWQNLLLALPLAGLLFFYLSSGIGEVDRGWIWSIHSGIMPEVIQVLLILYFTEFVILAFLLFLLKSQLRRDLLFFASLVTLLLLPMYSYGYHNDLVLRGQIPALFLLSYYCASLFGERSLDNKAKWAKRNWGLVGILVAVLSIGAVSPIFELVRVSKDHDFNVIRYAQMELDVSVLRSLWIPRELQYQYVAHDVPEWFRWLLRSADRDLPQSHVTGDVIIRSTYTVYREKQRLVYVKELCDREDVDTRFFLHVVPSDTNLLPPGRSHLSFDFEFSGHGWRIEETCIAVRELPSWFANGHITTGQFNAERTSHSWLRHYFGENFRNRLLAEAGEPIIRSSYDVYLHQEMAGDSSGEPNRFRLLYFKPACSQGDVKGRFYLHVVPVSRDSLSDERKGVGYNVLDFSFDDYGGMSDGSCFVVRELPEYDILEIRMGELSAEGEKLWEDRYALDK